MITIKAVEDLGMKERRFTRLAVGTLVVEDIVAIFLMVVLSTVAVSQGVSGGELAGTIAQLLFYLVLWLLLGIYLLPSFLKKVEPLLSDETLLVVSLGVCFGMVWLADAIGFSAALGAFLAGSILAGTSMQERIEHLVTSCKDLFGAVFFVSVGLKVDPAMLAEYLVPIVVLTLATIIGKVIFLMAGMLLAGEDLRTSLHGAFCLTQIGEFSISHCDLGHIAGRDGGFPLSGHRGRIGDHDFYDAVFDQERPIGLRKFCSASCRPNGARLLSAMMRRSIRLSRRGIRIGRPWRRAMSPPLPYMA